VDVYCPHYQEYRKEFYRGVKIVRIWNPERLFKKRALRALSNIVYDFLSLVHATFNGADIIYMLGYASGPCILLPRIFGRKVVVNPDGLEWRSLRWGIGARTWLYICEYLASIIPHKLIADAAPIAKRFEDKYGVVADCIPYGTELFDVDERIDTSEAVGSYYLAVARMVPETKIPEMISGFLKSNSTKKFLIIGPIADEQFYKKEILPLLNSERVRYLGPIYDKLLLKSLRHGAFALLHGHASEGTNPSLLESMGCGTPIIAIRRKSNIDVVGLDNGIYFDNDSSLANELEKFENLSDEDRISIGVRNKRKAATEYSWDTSVNRHFQIFQSLLAKDRYLANEKT
jgi:glycosyltransferase involved in cell wall biosynthesis